MFSRIPSLATLFLASVLACLPNTYAGASNKNGNPFGNGTFFQTTGTFSAVIRGQNLSGTMLFSTGASTNGGTNSSGGSCVISYLGDNNAGTLPGVYRGNAAGMWDPSQGTISGQFWGGQNRSGSNGTTIYPEIYNTNVYPALVPIVTNQVQSIFQIVTNSTLTVIGTNADGTTIISTNITITTVNLGTTNVLATNYIAVEPMGSNSFQDSVFMNGLFDGSVQNKYPNQTFSAQGTIAQQQLYPQQQGPNAIVTNADGTLTTNEPGTVPVQMGETLNIPVTVQGLRISDAYSSFTTISNAIPYTFTTYTVTNIPSQQGGL
jgi:hypothetical protein